MASWRRPRFLPGNPDEPDNPAGAQCGLGSFLRIRSPAQHSLDLKRAHREGAGFHKERRSRRGMLFRWRIAVGQSASGSRPALHQLRLPAGREGEIADSDRAVRGFANRRRRWLSIRFESRWRSQPATRSQWAAAWMTRTEGHYETWLAAAESRGKPRAAVALLFCWRVSVSGTGRGRR